ncbi:hypothetical protein ACP6C7_18830 [Mycolicibacterium septicum]|uniref:Minor tail protein n=2 Tax=Mycolicibacterium septicum TaxID=98668 RepID=A0ABW9LW01_9MYCO
MRRDFIELIVRKVVEALTGVFIPSAGDAIDQLHDWAVNLPVIGDIIATIDSVFSSIFGGIDFTDLPTPEEVWQSVTDGLGYLLGPRSPVNAANLFGRLGLPQFGGGVPLSALTAAVPNELEPFSAESVPTSDGWSFDAVANAAKVVCDGTAKNLYLGGAAIKVEPDQPLNVAFKVRYTGLTSGAGQTIKLVLNTYTSVDGSGTPTPVVVAGLMNPSGTASTVTIGNSSWSPPPGVGSVRPVLIVDGLVTAGTVYWENTPSLKKKLDPVFGDGLPKAIQDRIAEFQSVLGTFDELAQIFEGAVVDPVEAVGSVIKGWWDFWFGGGPNNVVSQAQIAEPTGVPPTDANNTIPWIYLPPELTPAAIGHPWVELTKAGTQTINKSAITKLTAWSQAGGFPLTVSSDQFSVPFAGLFHVSVKATWVTSPDVQARLYVYKNNSVYRRDTRITDGMSSVYSNEIHEYVPLDVGDVIDFRVDWTNTGTTKDISSNPVDTYVRITYIGATHLTATPIPTPTVTFDAKGAADNGSGDGGPWNHTFGANAKAIVIPFSHESPDMPVVTCGVHNVPVLSGPTFIGNYFGFNAYYSLAAAILPDAVKGTTQAVSVDFPSGNAAFSGNSLSFNNASYLGAVRYSSGSGGAGDPARIFVPSNAFSQVAGGFGGMDVNFSSFNRTQDNIWNFIAGNTWAHVIGHAQGGLEFTASAGKWAGKFIELHP